MPRGKVMDNYYHKENIGLLASRMTKGKEYAHVFATESISEVIYLSPLTGTNAFNFPLYIYPKDDQFLDSNSRVPNLNRDIIKAIERKINLIFNTEETKDKNSFSPIDILIISTQYYTLTIIELSTVNS